MGLQHWVILFFLQFFNFVWDLVRFCASMLLCLRMHIRIVGISGDFLSYSQIIRSNARGQLSPIGVQNAPAE
jgi:hypothetical protein